MSKKKKFFKALIWIVSSFCLLFAAAVLGAYLYFNYYLIPKISQGGENASGNEQISFTDVAKELSDKQVLDNIINFDKQSASEMLSALKDLGSEIEEPEKSDEPQNDDKKQQPDTKVNVEGNTAYQRIMNEASKDEISQGMSIISKVDISKVTELRRLGKNSEIKAYLKSVLTSSEISAALKLYNKYKHLL